MAATAVPMAQWLFPHIMAWLQDGFYVFDSFLRPAKCPRFSGKSFTLVLFVFRQKVGGVEFFQHQDAELFKNSLLSNQSFLISCVFLKQPLAFFFEEISKLLMCSLDVGIRPCWNPTWSPTHNGSI